MKTFIMLFLVLSCTSLFSQDNLLKAVSLNYKFKQVNKELNQDFTHLDPRSNIDYEIISGFEWEDFQPVGIFKNISDSTLTFRVRFRITNIDSGKVIYNRNVNVSDDCLRMKDEDTIFCMEDPRIRVRYCDVTEINGNYSATYLPYPPDENKKGIPPGGYVEVEFPPFQTNDFFGNHLGKCIVQMHIVPLVPETGDTLREKDFSDDTLKFNLLLKKKGCAEIYYPFDGDTIESGNNMFYSYTNNDPDSFKTLYFSKSQNFDSVVFSKFTLIQYNLVFEPNTKYYWQLKVQKLDSLCTSKTYSFFVKDVNSVKEDGEVRIIYPNPASDYIIVRANGHSPKQSEVVIYDVFGNKLLTTKPDANMQINVSALPTGTYFVRNGNEKPLKFVKM